MAGSMMETPAGSGTWRLRVSLGWRDPVTGQRPQKSKTVRGLTKAKAAKALAAMVTAADNGEYGVPLDRSVYGEKLDGRSSVAELLTAWLAWGTPGWAPNTTKQYEDALVILRGSPARQTIRESGVPGATRVEYGMGRVTQFASKARPGVPLMKLRIQDVDTQAVDSCYALLRRQGLSYWRMEQCHKVLKNAFSAALRWKVPGVTANPTTDAVRDKAPRKRPKIATIEQIMSVAEALERAGMPQVGMMVMFGYRTGVRRGILCGARWSDFDLASEQPIFTLNRNLTVVRNEMKMEPHGKHRTIADDKDVCYLTPGTVQLLRRLRTSQETVASALGIEAADDGYLLSMDGMGEAPMHPDKFNWRMKVASESLGHRLTPHMLRHSMITHLLDAGVSPATIAAMVHHRDGGETIFANYAHTDESKQRTAADVLDRLTAAGELDLAS